MAKRKLTPQQLDEVVKREAPGYQVARKPSAAADAREQHAERAAEDMTPDVEQAKRKSAPKAPGSAPDARATSRAAAPSGAGGLAADAADDDVQIVALEPQHPVDPWDRGSRPKSIVVNGDGRVIGRQG